MTPVSTNIKIDPDLKEQSQALFESFGLRLERGNQYVSPASCSGAGDSVPGWEPFAKLGNAPGHRERKKGNRAESGLFLCGGADGGS